MKQVPIVICVCPLCGEAKPEQKRFTLAKRERSGETIEKERRCRTCASIVTQLDTNHSNADFQKEYLCPICGEISAIANTVYYNRIKKNAPCPECLALERMGPQWKAKIKSVSYARKVTPSEFNFFGCHLTRERRIMADGVASNRCRLHQNCIFYDFCLTVTSANYWNGFTATGEGHPIKYDKFGTRISPQLQEIKSCWFNKSF